MLEKTKQLDPHWDICNILRKWVKNVIPFYDEDAIITHKPWSLLKHMDHVNLKFEIHSKKTFWENDESYLPFQMPLAYHPIL